MRIDEIYDVCLVRHSMCMPSVIQCYTYLCYDVMQYICTRDRILIGVYTV